MVDQLNTMLFFINIQSFFVGGEVNTYVEAEQQNIVDVVLNVKENTITTKSAI